MLIRLIHSKPGYNTLEEVYGVEISSCEIKQVPERCTMTSVAIPYLIFAKNAKKKNRKLDKKQEGVIRATISSNLLSFHLDYLHKALHNILRMYSYPNTPAPAKHTHPCSNIS